jgi:hypothetical protein
MTIHPSCRKHSINVTNAPACSPVPSLAGIRARPEAPQHDLLQRTGRAACGFFTALPAWTAEPSGCDKFKWPIDHERAILTSEPFRIESGATLAPTAGKPVRIALRPAAQAGLPTPPERAPRDERQTFAGYLQLSAIPTAGIYAISLSAAAWLDAIQDGKPLKTVAFSGATDCDGIRKVVQFELRAAPLLLQLSGVASDSIILAITPVR